MRPGAIFPHTLTAVLSLAVGVMLCQTIPAPTPEPICEPMETKPAVHTVIPPVTLHPTVYQRYECWHAIETGRLLPKECV